MKTKKSTKQDKLKKTKKAEKIYQNPKVIVISLLVAMLVVASCILLAVKLNKPEEESNPEVLILHGEWKDITTSSSIKFEGENFYLDSEGPYRYRYDESAQMIYVEYIGGDIIRLQCKFVDGCWRLNMSQGNQSFSFVPAAKRDELRNQAIAKKWENHTKDRTEVILGQEYTTADGITFTITSGEMRNTPDVVDATAVINLYINCSANSIKEHWVESTVCTPTRNPSFGNTYFDLGADVTFYQNIAGVTELGKEPYDYCIMQFEFGGSKYYLDLLTLNLIAE